MLEILGKGTLEASERERGVAVGLNLRVDVGAAVQQQPYGRRVAVHRCQHQRRDAQLGACAGVDLRLDSAIHGVSNMYIYKKVDKAISLFLP